MREIRVFLGAALLAGFAAALASCGSSGSSNPAAAPHPRFDVPSASSVPIPGIETPYPNDLYRDAAGHIQIPPAKLPYDHSSADPSAIQNVSDALALADGFGLSSGAIFPIAATAMGDGVDPATVTAATVQLVDLADGSSIPLDIHVRATEQQINLLPKDGIILLEHHTYAYLLLDGIATTTSKTKLVADPNLTALLAAAPATGADAYKPLRDHLAAHSIAASTIIGATVFTTTGYTAAMQAGHDEIAAQTYTPVIDKVYSDLTGLADFMGTPVDNEFPGGDNAGGVAHGHIAFVVLGHFDSPNFLSATASTLGRFELDAAGKPKIKGTTPVPFLLALPTKANPADYANTPVVIFQHGLGGSRADVLNVANSLCTRGYAVIGIDIPFHGDRLLPVRDNKHDITGATGPDGLGDYQGQNSLLAFMDIVGDSAHGVEKFDPQVISGNFKQAALDMMAETHLIKSGDWSSLKTMFTPLAQLSFNGDKITFSSESFGSIIGIVAVTFEPDLGAAVFSVGGGGLVYPLLENSYEYFPLFGQLIEGAFGVNPAEVDAATDAPHTHIAFLLMESLIESGDPIVYARHAIREPLGVPKNIALLSVFSDESVPNQANEDMAVQLGLDWVQTSRSSPGTRYVDMLPSKTAPMSGNVTVGGKTVTAGFLQLADASHGMITQHFGARRAMPGGPPFVPLDPPLMLTNPIAEVQALLGDFADAWVGGQTPPVNDTFKH